MEKHRIRHLMTSDNYIFQTIIAQTNCTQIFKAWDKRHSKYVAIKRLNLLQASALLFKQFTNELKIRSILASKQCCYYAETLERFEDIDHLYLVMELGQGDLFSYVESHGPLQESEAKLLFEQLLNSIDQLHQQNIAHRDLKLENIVFRANVPDSCPHLLLIDFGMSCCFEHGTTHVDDTYGTIGYFSPEELISSQGDSKYCALKTDVWTLGIILYVMLEGIFPFVNNDHVLDPNWRPRFIYNHSSSVKDILRQMLKLNPLDRPTTGELLKHPWFDCVSS